ARLVARSPCSAFAGRSISTAGRSASWIAGSAPAAIARSQAAATALRASVRRGGAGNVGACEDTGAAPWSGWGSDGEAVAGSDEPDWASVEGTHRCKRPRPIVAHLDVGQQGGARRLRARQPPDGRA